MNEENRLPESICFAVVSGFAASWDWAAHHLTVAGSVAVVAGAFSIWASWETIKARRAERKKAEKP